MKAISIDCETLGVGTPQPHLLEIGACLFDTDVVKDKVYQTGRPVLRLDIEHVGQPGGVVTPSTVLWWMQQGAQMKSLMDKQPRLALKAALLLLQSFIWENVSRYNAPVWFRGDDHTWLEEHYKKQDLVCPWQYNGVRDQRTLTEFAQSKGWAPPIREIAHDGLADALQQAEDVVSVYNYLTGGNDHVAA